MTQTLHRSGGYTPIEESVLYRHRLVNDDVRHAGMIFLTGSTGGAVQPFQISAMGLVLQAVADAGVDVLVIEGGGPATWGNDTAVAAIHAALGYGRASLGWHLDRPVLVAGYSMGGLDAMNYAARHLGEVAGFLGFAPVSDLGYHQATNFTAAIDAAYGGSYATNGAGHDPTRDLAASLATKPWRAWYATDDATIPRATVETLASLTGGSLVASTGGHVGIWGNVVPGDVAGWVTQALA